MDLKSRFSLYFSLVLTLLLTAFSLAVYSQVKKKLVSTAATSLATAVDHEWRHMELHHGVNPEAGETLHTKDAYIKVWREDHLVRDTLPPAWRSLTESTLKGDSSKLVHRVTHVLDGTTYTLLGIFDLTRTETYLSALRRILWLGCLLSAILILPLSWFFTKSLLSPFRTLSLKTLELDAEKLSFRFEEPRQKDEFGILVRSINTLLTRLEKSFKQTRRFATNASHELRTPLTVIRGEAELMLRRERSAPDYQLALSNILAQAETLQGIVTRLLFLADLERMEQEGSRADIDVGRTVSEALKCLKVAHAGLGRQVEVEGTDVVFQGDREIFGSVVTNVVENAFKYSRSRIRIRYERGAGGVHFNVDDDGPGIPESRREIVFEPFFRRPEAVQHAKGHGIGLSIVKACVQVARGKISLADSPLGGLSVQVFIPEAPTLPA